MHVSTFVKTSLKVNAKIVPQQLGYPPWIIHTVLHTILQGNLYTECVTIHGSKHAVYLCTVY